MLPSLEYRKNNLLDNRFDILYTAAYSRNYTTNVATASHNYNWRGEQDLRHLVSGEQVLLHSQAINDNFNTSLNLAYRLAPSHRLTLNGLYQTSSRHNRNLLLANAPKEAADKRSHKIVAGLSYRFKPSKRWEATAFAKYYRIGASGEVETAENSGVWQKQSQSSENLGFGIATSYFILPSLQAKLSYERATRLPSVNELFGDEDLETAALTLRPERSHNLNFSLSFDKHFGKHALSAEAGIVYRNTQDYIMRNIIALPANRGFNASHLNYGRVLTQGINASVGYAFGKWASLDMRFTYMNIRDNEPYMFGTTLPNIAKGARMPNTPYFFTDTQLSLSYPDLFSTGDMLSLHYDLPFVEAFPLYSERIGRQNGTFEVPRQMAHNLSLTYSMKEGRYNLSFEAKNLGNARLYDNYSLEKPGRAFYIK